MKPVSFNFSIAREEGRKIGFRLKQSDGSLLETDGTPVRCQLRKGAFGEVVDELTTDNGRITNDGAGTIWLTFPADGDVPAGCYSYDLRLDMEGDSPMYVAKGVITMKEMVTK